MWYSIVGDDEPALTSQLPFGPWAGREAALEALKRMRERNKRAESVLRSTDAKICGPYDSREAARKAEYSDPGELVVNEGRVFVTQDGARFPQSSIVVKRKDGWELQPPEGRDGGWKKTGHIYTTRRSAVRAALKAFSLKHDRGAGGPSNLRAVRWLDSEWEEVGRIAEEAGMDRSKWIRDRALRRI